MPTPLPLFEFATAGRVIAGRGALAAAGAAARALGRRALIVTGRSPERGGALARHLAAAGVSSATFSVEGEPSTSTAADGVLVAIGEHCDLVVGIGGGSAIDAAKAIAALAANGGELFDYLEVIGRGQPLAAASWPMIAIPTTAGTGSEVTRNAVLASPEHQVKVSLRSASMLPRVAIVDPDLTRDLPAMLTATTGLDALTQLIEPYVSSRANPMVDALCVEGLRRAAVALPRACRDGEDLAARADMALAALWSGMALANAGLGAVHGLAGPIGGMFTAPHGGVCAALLPHVVAGNLDALRRAGDGRTVARFDAVARLLTGSPTASADDGVLWVSRLVEEFGVPSLRAYGVTPDRIADIIEPARRANSMKANPVELTAQQLTEILQRAI